MPGEDSGKGKAGNRIGNWGCKFSFVNFIEAVTKMAGSSKHSKEDTKQGKGWI